MKMTEQELLAWLKEEDPGKLEELWQLADRVRHENVGNAVHLRGLIELSNYCTRSCHYCGLRVERKDLERYRMTFDEIWECVEKAVAFEYGTVVLQSGEDPGQSPQFIESLIQKIKSETSLAVTLSLGEQSDDVLRSWRDAGADRYLLRIETTNKALLETIHPGQPYGERQETLERLKKLGFEVGSGIMVGIPGQRYDMVVKDIRWFEEFDLDMIGIGPYLPHPATPLAQQEVVTPSEQVPRSELMANKAIALTRVTCPSVNIPATTALASINKNDGREFALSHGANVVMPNLTPARYRQLYEIYPNKACLQDTAEVCQSCMKKRILNTGREIGKGKGSRIK